MEKIEHKHISYKELSLLILVIPLLILCSCKKLVEVDGPSTSLNSANIYENSNTAASVLTSVYTNLSAENLQSGSLPSMSYLGGLSSDELVMYNPSSAANLNGYYINDLGVNVAGYEFWNSTYPNIYIANAAIEGLSSSKTLEQSVKQQLIGEAKFIRAFCFFYLVNLYGDVPLTLTTDFKTNASMARTPKDQVWQQIITDLKDAQSLLSADYKDATLSALSLERVRPTKAAATALLARAYLYTNDWQNAEVQATSLLANPSYSLVDLNDAFKRNNKEAIWQLQPVIKGNTLEGQAFIIVSLMDASVYLSQGLLNSFDPGDMRKTKWIADFNANGTVYPYANKYKIPYNPEATVEEYATVFRLAEQYLIRAEARVHLGKIPEGISDLNILRDRASDKTGNLPSRLKALSPNLSGNAALSAVEKERRTELFAEWGHRWLDLKRTGRIDDVMSVATVEKDPIASWKNTSQLFPIPINDLKNNPRLVQNPGY